jgi:predicted metal-binding transcription factor (methanogenesis marker protein 9)
MDGFLVSQGDATVFISLVWITKASTWHGCSTYRSQQKSIKKIGSCTNEFVNLWFLLEN